MWHDCQTAASPWGRGEAPQRCGLRNVWAFILRVKDKGVQKSLVPSGMDHPASIKAANYIWS